MRISTALFARAVKPRVHTRVADLARSDSKRTWSRKTAQVLEIGLRNQANLGWAIIKQFCDLPPHKDDVKPLLPHLEAKALSQFQSERQTTGFHVVGELALKSGLGDALNEKFIAQWVNALKSTNPFRAIEIHKLFSGSQPSLRSIDLYLAANQVDAAASSANQILAESQVLPSMIFRGLISRYLESQNIKEAQAWINKWQSMNPEDINWLHHSVRSQLDAQLTSQLTLPKPGERVAFPEPNRSIGVKLQHLVSQINTVLAGNPELLADQRVTPLWLNSILNPGISTLHALVIAVAQLITEIDARDWVKLIRLVDANTAIAVLQAQPSKFSPRAYAAAISRTQNEEQLSQLLQLITPDILYTAECLAALAHRNPEIFSQIIVPPEILETSLQEHHLIALWSTDPGDEICKWLMPLTLKLVHSPRLLRSALMSVARQGKCQYAFDLLTEYLVNRRLNLDKRLYTRSREPKLPRPQVNTNFDMETARLQVQSVLRELSL